ncbi:hypothetical protein GLAREA_05786 [Glarea lozoyensis ATCC 20868]|uniref:Uncharacterized protein n=1 Tax=Glarea lozoyensis (strain ATCC 20868 / MF5171) TaxID=1116229 RepID=S3EDT4_GLAL2|nr:uncharacterized protein GLAREA_05786 [Glarea lozoyensis ATCC 20868]EPE36448.1 hypothetical protein GLAREA_05786 [Glarea lozoyensis ATCC 20868]
MAKEIRLCAYEETPDVVPESSSPFKFTSLSREIRDQIYVWALVAPSPIIVWKGQWGTDTDKTRRLHSYTTFTDVVQIRKETHRRWIDPSATKHSLAECSTNLFFCNKQIGEEAAKVFYRKNVFAFLGDHNWDPIVSWLTMINNRNRNHLATLEFKAYRPEEVWQRPNGERDTREEDSREPDYPRNPHLHFSTPIKYGLVEIINPAIEEIFQLLGQQKTSTHKVTINFKLRYNYPGCGWVVEEGDHYPQDGWCSMDLPNLVEKFRTLYSPKSLVDVIWTGKCPKEIVGRGDRDYTRTSIEVHLENMKNKGWEVEISPMEGDNWEWALYDKYDAEDKHIPSMVLRRMPLKEPLIGDDPNPWAGALRRLSSEEYELEKTNHYYD